MSVSGVSLASKTKNGLVSTKGKRYFVTAYILSSGNGGVGAWRHMGLLRGIASEGKLHI